MGRTGRRAAKQAAVIGATPATDNTVLKDLRPGRDADLGNADKPSGPKVSKVKTGAFFTVPPRTEILDTKKSTNGLDTFKQNPAKQVGLGEIQAAMWARTAASKGGAKDATAAPVERAVRLIQEKAELEQAGKEEALMSSEGFRAYAHEMVWGARAEGEADDEPLDEADPVQVAERMRVLWKNWRKLPGEQQRKWGDKQLAQEAAAALQRTAGTKHSQPAKVRRAAASVPTADPINSKRKGKHGVPKKQRKSEGSTPDKLGEEYKRAEALKFSRMALLAEMSNWEEEDEEEEAAAAAGVTVEELRQKRQEEAAAAAAAAEEAAKDDNQQQNEGAAAAAGTNKAAARKGKKRKAAPAAGCSRGGKSAKDDDEQHDEEVEAIKQNQKPAPKRAKRALAAPAAHKPKAAKANAKADSSAAATPAAASKGTKKASSKVAAAVKVAKGWPSKQKGAEGLGWIDSDADEDSDEDAVGADELAAMHKALSDGDDSDADASDQDMQEEGSGDEQEGEEQQQRAACATGARASGNAAIAQAKAEAARKAAAAAAKAAAVAAAAAAAAEAEARAADAEAKAVAAKAKRKAKGKKTVAETEKASKAADRGSRKRKAAAAETDDGAPAPAPAAFNKTRKQQQSPRRSGRSQRPTEEAPSAMEDDDGPAVSGAGPSSVPRRGRSAAVGGAKAAQQEALELQLFSNTRRKSVGRADSPGLVALAAAAAHQQQPRSRLGKSKK